ncbi:unnamed protein product [Lactuca virosa]|uniref:Receptor ligand binding region domain-containing protein n=1 Tax=Lactuca virosa TaxID=75947 RepID=A0AAU9M4E3_9ASTR|nr:unnamed protein product [Lactuca virosa]
MTYEEADVVTLLKIVIEDPKDDYVILKEPEGLGGGNSRGGGGCCSLPSSSSPSSSVGGGFWCSLWWWSKLVLVFIFLAVVGVCFFLWIRPFLMIKERSNWISEIIPTSITSIPLFLTYFRRCIQKLKKINLAYKETPVGVILYMGSSYPYSGVGRTIHSCITMAVSEFYMVNPHFQTRIILHHRDTHGDPLHALSAALDLLEKPKVQAIIGLESTAEAKFLAVLGDKARVPILSLSPCLSCNKHPYFLQVTQDENETTQFKGIAAMAESFRRKEVILICEDSDSGRDMTNTLQTKSILVTHRSLISTSWSNELLQEELHRLSTMQTKIFIMHASPSIASHLLVNAKHLGMMDEGYKWIIIGKTMKFLNLLDDEVIESMQGAVGFKLYVPQSRDLHNFTYRRRRKNHVMVKLQEINSYALWVYDAVSALAMAVEQFEQLKRKYVDTIASDLTQSQKGTTLLLNEMLSISFHGLGGAFQLRNGKINDAQVMEIVNVIDKVSDEGLEAIIWPKGGITTNPTHRMLQASSKILRIAIPPKFGVGRVFQVKYDAETNSTVVSGFCADVFRTAFKGLGRDISFQFIPFTGEDRIINYNELIYRVYTGLKPVLEEIERRSSRKEYVQILPECHRIYCEQRLSLVKGIVSQRISEYSKKETLPSLTRSRCAYLMHVSNLCHPVCQLEHQLFDHFFPSTSEDITSMAPLVDPLCTFLYDTLRRKLIHETNLDVLCELVDILKIEVIGEQLRRRSESLAGIRPTLDRILADIHERLTFRARTHIRDEITNYLPLDEDLDQIRSHFY